MQTSAETYLSKIIHNNTLRTHIRQSLAVLSLLVVLTVFWGLKLTGITLAGEAFCGKEEHTHSEECPLRNLTCELDEMEAHTHTEACLVREQICELEETDAHHHTDDCLTQIPVCTLPEQEAHTHSDECLIRTLTCGLPEQEGHNHSDDCLSKTLSCGLQEQQGHSHSDACLSKTLSCGQEEISAHTHNADCYQLNLVCSKPETEGHSHGSGCFELVHTCGLEENEAHTHDDSCLSEIQVCQLPETEGHRHTDGCYQNDLICTMAETAGHSHCDNCYTTGSDYICGQEEVPAHQHSEACYTIGSDIICGKEETEAHSHSDECYTIEPGYGCGMEEMDAHTHTEECFTTEAGNFSCGLEETEGHTHCEECYRFGIGFGCGLTEAEGHVHTEECITEETEFGCGKISGPGHTHTDECYDILEYCPLEEHTHDISCYSDITADIETSDDWEMSMADLIFSTRTSDNIVMVAKSQLGCVESQRNFQVDEFGVRHGITRYGQWYNNPYGDWSAMFVSFCLHYAGVEEVPFNAGVDSMRLEWETAGLYYPVAEFSPVVGHLLFLDEDLNGTADTVAIITELSETEILCIEGDVEQSLPLPDETEEEGTEAAEEILPLHIVAETAYAYDDPRILGYGLVPFAPELRMMSARAASVIAKTTAYSADMFTSNANFVMYTSTGSNYYALDGSGNAVQIFIDTEGNITANVNDPDSLLWTFTPSGSNNSYQIQNLGTGRYLYAENNAVTSTTSGTSWLNSSGSGAKIQSNGSYIRFNTASSIFQPTNNLQNGAVFQFGIVETHTVWLDGTNGGIMSLGGSPDKSFSVNHNDVMELPTHWDSPAKYSYTLRGWYDVINARYYEPGELVTVTDNMVFYADWKASTYDIGRFNSRISDTVSTNDFITTHVFDYGVLFNVLSEDVTVTVDENSHKEVWSLLTSGSNEYNGTDTLGFIFRDWDRGNEDISYPQNTNSINNPTNGGVFPNLYTQEVGNLLFNPGTTIIGKQHLGTADHLFQLMDDPNDSHYGYFYYDSERNAASYNQSDGRFYVYDYLECTRTSAGSNDEGKYSDFLPLNSPYANTNGKNVTTYSYSGVNGEYDGVTHYMYDCRYDTEGSSPSNAGTNFLFGMSIDISFYLPVSPGTRDADGNFGNRDLNGNEMHFQFSGDDDVWIFVDGQLVLDLGGVHGIEKGDINFSSGEYNVYGESPSSGSISHLKPGEHTLTLYYMERGSSMSNCAIYFNLAPRYSFSIQKEDMLTQNVLNGAEFSVYTDNSCTVPAALWTSKAAHDRGESATNVFTVENGVANMWGMGAGNTYYIKETKPPDDPNYDGPNGIIQLTFDKSGTASYNVTVLPDKDGNVSAGFTVHGFRIDEETQKAYIIATNAPKWAQETTSVQVMKNWADGLDHTGESITVYLTVTDADGTVRRLQEMVLSSENNWTGKWDNLIKYRDENKTPVQYGVEEAYTPGYYSSTENKTGSFEISRTQWSDVSEFGNNKVYLLKNSSGQCLSTQQNAADTGFMWVSQSTAVSSNLAKWTAAVKNNTVRLTNLAGQTITFWYGNGSPTDFFALNQHVEDNNQKQYLSVYDYNEELLLSYDRYYLSHTMLSNGKFDDTQNINQALLITPVSEITTSTTVPIENQGFLITNTPLEQETSLTVQKYWDYGNLNPGTEHEKAQVTVKLLANGRYTGRTVTLSLKNGWQDTFQGLPYTDSSGNVIQYTVQESWDNPDWIPKYGEITVTAADIPTYSTTITNVNRWGTGGPELPSTGTSARMMYTYCGYGIMLGSLLCGIVSRRRRERRRT